MKLCSKCLVEKPKTKFYKKTQSKDGLMSYCKECDDVKRKKYSEANSEKEESRRKQYYQKNSEKIKKRVQKYYVENSDKIQEYQKQYCLMNFNKVSSDRKLYRTENKKYFREYYLKYYEENKSSFLARSSTRRARKLKATPSWLTEDHHEEIKDLFLIAKAFQIYTGLQYHVDHIVPLQGKTVCGLHVPWNLQVLEEKENLSKSNKYAE